MRLLLLTPAEISRDVRARRAAAAAQARGFDVAAACGQISGEPPVPFEGVRVARAGRAGRAHRLWGVAPAARPRSHAARDVRGVFRLARLLLRTVGLVRAARPLGPATVVHANDLDTLPAGLVLARDWGARLVYDAHELYSEFEAPAPPVTRRLTLALERALARQADAVVTVSDGIADELVQRLGLASRPLVVVNAPHREERPLREFDGGPLRAVYQGRLGPGRPLGDLLAAAAGADGVELSLRIPLVDPQAIRKSVEARGLDGRVKVLEPVPPARVLDALGEFEVGVLFDRPQSRNSELSFPNKLFEYLMAGLAVVAPRLDSLGPLLEEEGVGVTFEPGRPDRLAETLTQLAADRERLLELRRRARDLALSRLNAEAAADTLAAAWDAGRAG